MFISLRCDVFRWSAVFRMSPSSSTSTGSQIATWRRSLTQTRREFGLIFNHCWRERCSSDYRRFSLNPVQRDIFPHRQSQLSDLTIRLHITTSLKFISQKRWLYHQIFKWSSWPVQFTQCQSRDQSFIVLIGLCLVAEATVKVGHKYVNVHRHQLLISSEINNVWSMTVTVLQRKTSKQQIGLLLVPAIKGAVYINTHCNYSQPVLTKLYNENVGGHPYIFTGVWKIKVFDQYLALFRKRYNTAKFIMEDELDCSQRVQT